MSTKELKRRACKSLQGKWVFAIFVGIVAIFFVGDFMGFPEFEYEIKQSFTDKNNIHSQLVFTISILGMRFGQSVDAMRHPELFSSLAFLAGIAAVMAAIFSIMKLIVTIVLGGCVEVGYADYHLKLYDGEKASIKDLFGTFDRFADCIALFWLKFLYTLLWSLLFLIPGIIAGYKYSMAAYILRDNPGMKASEAIEASKKLMDGHKMELFVLELTFLGWMILGVLTLGIGMLVLEPYMMAAKTAFYKRLIEEKNNYKEANTVTVDYSQSIIENIL